MNTKITNVRPYFKTNGNFGNVLVSADFKHGTRKFSGTVEGAWSHEGLVKEGLHFSFKDARHRTVTDNKLVHVFKLHLQQAATDCVRRQAPEQLMQEIRHLNMQLQRVTWQLQAVGAALREDT